MPLTQRLSSEHGVGPVYGELDIAPSTYYRYQQCLRHREIHTSHIEKRDGWLKQ